MQVRKGINLAVCGDPEGFSCGCFDAAARFVSKKGNRVLRYVPTMCQVGGGVAREPTVLRAPKCKASLDILV